MGDRRGRTYRSGDRLFSRGRLSGRLPELSSGADEPLVRSSWRSRVGSGIQARARTPVSCTAGGGLALATLLAMQGHGCPAAAFTMSAWTDLAATGASYETRAASDPIHQRSMILAMARNALGKDGDPRSPLVSPLYALPEQLGILPPLLLQVGDRETVLSDSQEFVRKVRDAGGQAQCDVWPEMVHVFQQFPDELSEARDALERGGRFLAMQLDATD